MTMSSFMGPPVSIEFNKVVSVRVGRIIAPFDAEDQ
jgi:hypothetical protein